MSRTDKDRPYWVRENDEGNPVHHNHLLFGAKRYRRAYVLDENGDYIYEDHIRNYVTFNDLKAEKFGITYEQACSGFTVPFRKYQYPSDLAIDDINRRNPEYGWLWKGHSYVSGRFAKIEMVLDFSYADSCTEGYKNTTNGRGYPGRELPCQPELPPEFHRYRDRARKGDRIEYNGRRRADKGDKLRYYAKAWNSDVEFDEAIELTSQHHHGISWWY